MSCNYNLDDVVGAFQLILYNVHAVRYIDDLLTLNNPAFEQEIPNIYPPQLVLKKTTETPNKLSYLDICIQIQGRKFCSSVYDKRDALNFI